MLRNKGQIKPLAELNSKQDIIRKSYIYVKETCGLFARIVGKVSAMIALQYINYINNKSIGRIKYALV